MILPEGIDAEAFREAMLQPPVVSLKINRRKCLDAASLGYGEMEPVAWCGSGFYLDKRPRFTLNPLLHAGVFYVQDASSMIYESIVSKLVSDGEIPPQAAVLDLCAAPGGKTTSMINALPDGSLVVANEALPKRAAVLRENIVKWGYPMSAVTNSSTGEIARLGEIFDLVAVDAPCSGEGMMRKDEDAVSQWSPALVAKCAALQRTILSDAVKLLKPGGILIYSTCTFNRKENEENAEWLCDAFGLTPVDMGFPEEWGIGKQLDSEAPAMRFMPHITRGEGLFVAVFKKAADREGAAIHVSHDKIIRRLASETRLLHPRASEPAVRDKNKSRNKKASVAGQPDATEVFTVGFDASKYPRHELTEAEALAYLRREALRLPPDTPKGFVTVKFKGYPLGFVKNIGNRANNLYPSEWRIRMGVNLNGPEEQ